MSARLNVPLRRSRSNFPWNISMAFFSSAGDFCAVWVFLLSEMRWRRQNPQNHRSENLNSSAINCLARAENYHLFTALPSEHILRNSSCNCFSTSGKQAFRPLPGAFAFNFCFLIFSSAFTQLQTCFLSRLKCCDVWWTFFPFSWNHVNYS